MQPTFFHSDLFRPLYLLTATCKRILQNLIDIEARWVCFETSFPSPLLEASITKSGQGENSAPSSYGRYTGQLHVKRPSNAASYPLKSSGWLESWHGADDTLPHVNYTSIPLIITRWAFPLKQDTQLPHRFIRLGR